MNRGLILGLFVLLAAGGGAIFYLASSPQPPVAPPAAPGNGGQAGNVVGEAGANAEAVDLSGNKEPDPSGDTAPSVGSTGTGAKAVPAVLPSKEPFVGWEPPALAILLSGEQFGSIEPCGCSLKQLGGMSRRMDLVAAIEKKGWPVIGFDWGEPSIRSGPPGNSPR